jgi:hypothetical protein
MLDILVVPLFQSQFIYIYIYILQSFKIQLSKNWDAMLHPKTAASLPPFQLLTRTSSEKRREEDKKNETKKS